MVNMAAKHALIAAAFILLCFGAVLRLQNRASEKLYSVKSDSLQTAHEYVNNESESSESIFTQKAASSNKQYAYTNLDNAHGKHDRQLWKSITPAFKCPDDLLTRVGNSGDGGKWTCGLYRLGSYHEENPSARCIVYSFGVSNDSSFEAEVLTNTCCSLYAYDPTVESIAKPLSPLNPRQHFFKMGLGGNNTKNRKTLKTMMEENGGHNWIDILKMDIESSEHAAFENIFMDFDELPFGQLLIEIHFGGKNTVEMGEKIIKLISDLEKRGLRMFYTEINDIVPNCCSEFSFLNTRALEKFMDTT